VLVHVAGHFAVEPRVGKLGSKSGSDSRSSSSSYIVRSTTCGTNFGNGGHAYCFTAESLFCDIGLNDMIVSKSSPSKILNAGVPISEISLVIWSRFLFQARIASS
jgi:hypothetical protein